MSGISTSLTWLCAAESAIGAAQAIDATGDFSAISPWQEDKILYVTSRNDHLEINLRNLLEVYQSQQASFYRTTHQYMLQGSKPFAACLVGTLISEAERGIVKLLHDMRSHPDACQRLWEGKEERDSLVAALHASAPPSFEIARQHFQRGEDNVRFIDVLMFLYAHRLAFQRAREQGLAVVYAVQPY